MAKAGRGSDQFVARLPDGMRSHLKDAADRNGRSMNAEIVERLSSSFFRWPNIEIPTELYRRVLNAGPTFADQLEAKIITQVFETIESALPAERDVESDVVTGFESLILDLPPKLRNDLLKKHQSLIAEVKSLKEG